MKELSPDYTDIRHLPLHEITARHGEDGLRRRFDYMVEDQPWNQEAKDNTIAAELIALRAHAGDMRGDLPYSTHFLRVAARVISPDHLGISDPQIAQAALLHDTVEDHPEFWRTIAASTSDNDRQHALNVITQLFDPRVASMVDAVTNADYPDDITSREDKNEFYRQHVVQVLKTDSDAGIIKLSDFIDNCVGLLHNESPARKSRLAAKYRPLILHFKSFVVTCGQFNPDKQAYLCAQLDKADTRCAELLS